LPTPGPRAGTRDTRRRRQQAKKRFAALAAASRARFPLTTAANGAAGHLTAFFRWEGAGGLAPLGSARQPLWSHGPTLFGCCFFFWLSCYVCGRTKAFWGRSGTKRSRAERSGAAVTVDDRG